MATLANPHPLKANEYGQYNLLALLGNGLGIQGNYHYRFGMQYVPAKGKAVTYQYLGKTYYFC
ncbi:MAG TPA: hypothetical protein ACFYEM_10205 [Candidatus Hypogeohydataceae bacterium YC40]